MTTTSDIERAIEDFGGAKWAHGRHGATEQVMGEVERTAEVLRAHIKVFAGQKVMAERRRILAGVKALQ